MLTVITMKTVKQRKSVTEKNSKEPPEITTNSSRFAKIKTTVKIMFICFLNLSVGCVFAYTSPALPSIVGSRPGAVRSFDLSLEQQSLVGSIATLGGFSASLFGGILAEKYGWKLCLVVHILPFVTGWLLIIAATDATLLIAGRFLTGMCISISQMMVPGYITETSTPELRDSAGAYLCTTTAVGMLLMNLSGVFLSWRYMALGCVALLTVTMMTLPFMRESPRWLVSKGQDEAANENMCWLRGTDDVHDEMNRIREQCSQVKNNLPLIDIMRSKSIRVQFLKALALMSFQTFTGIDFLWFYTEDLFNASGVHLGSHLQSNVFSFFGIAGGIVSGIVLKKIGRRTALVTSAGALCSCFLLMGAFFKIKTDYPSVASTYLSWLPVSCMVIFNFSYFFAWGPLPPIIMNEILPARGRAICMGIVCSVMWLGEFMVTKLSTIITDTCLHEYGLFWLYAASIFVSILFVIYLVPETKGKTLEDIEIEEHNRINSNNTQCAK